MNNVAKQTLVSDSSTKVAPGGSGGLTIPLAPQPKKQIMGLMLFSLLGLAALAFILFNIYQGIFIVKSPSAMVSAPAIDIRAYNSGIFNNQINVDAVTVEPGQTIGSVTPHRIDSTTTNDMTANTPQAGSAITSPCDCVIADVHVYNGQYVAAGEKIMSLVPSDAKPWIMAEIEQDKAMKLAKDMKATVLIAGSQVTYTGKIVSLKSALSQEGGGMNPDNSPRPVVAKIILDQTVPADFVNRPAKVTFSTR